MLHKTDQQLKHPLTYFYKTDLGPCLNLPESNRTVRFGSPDRYESNFPVYMCHKVKPEELKAKSLELSFY